MAAPHRGDTAAQWYARGEAALADGHLLEAERALWECLAVLPNHAAALHLLGRIRARQGQAAAALALQQRSEALDPGLGWNAFAAGELLEQQQCWEEAHAAFQRAERALPQLDWIAQRRRQAEGLAWLGGERLADGLSPRAYQLWCAHLEPPLLRAPGGGQPAAAAAAGLADWWLDLGADADLRLGALQWLQHQLQPSLPQEPNGDWTAAAPIGSACTGAESLHAESIHADLLYCDEDRLSDAGSRLDPWFKPGWQEESFWATPWLDGLAIWRRAWLKAQGLPPAPGPDRPLERWQWQLQALSCRPRVGHLPRVLVHRRLGRIPAAEQQARAELLGRHLDQRREGAVTVSPQGEGHALCWAVPASTGVTLVVCSRDRPDLLGRCLHSLDTSIQHRCSHRALHWQWLVVDNGSRLQATADLLTSWQQRPGCRLHSLELDQPFNWSLLNNRAALEATGDLLLFLNNDTRSTALTPPDWLAVMAGLALRPVIGAVGACLLQPDGRLQHAGLLPSLGAGCEHPYRGLPPDHGVHRGRSRYLTVWPAVTGACLMLRRQLFLARGGFDPGLPLEGNDVDLCLRLGHSGLRQVVAPQVLLEHAEGSSRGRNQGASRSWRAAMELLRRRWPAAFGDGDSCWPAACSLEVSDGRPRELAGRGWL